MLCYVRNECVGPTTTIGVKSGHFTGFSTLYHVVTLAIELIIGRSSNQIPRNSAETEKFGCSARNSTARRKLWALAFSYWRRRPPTSFSKSSNRRFLSSSIAVWYTISGEYHVGNWFTFNLQHLRFSS